MSSKKQFLLLLLEYLQDFSRVIYITNTKVAQRNPALITSRPQNASLYDGLMGVLLFNLFTGKKTK